MAKSKIKRNKVARLIGEICMAWANLEHCIWFLTRLHIPFNAPIDHLIVASELDMRGRISTARALCFRYGPKKYQYDLEVCLAFIDNKIRPSRNRFVHDQYSFYLERASKIHIATKIVKIESFKRELETINSSPVSIGHMSATVAAIKSAQGYVSKYISRVQNIRGDHIGVDPEKSIIDEVVNATEDSYESELQNFKDAMASYIEATKASPS